MKYFKYFMIVLTVLLVVPFSVFAEDDTSSNTTGDTTDKKVKVYLFRGEGCPHCQEAEEWFDSIKGEYGDYFKIVDYEVWNDEDNAALMEKVGKARNEEVTGVPYIIIGDKSWNGFAESMEDEMLDQIKTVYAQDVADRYDIMSYVDSGKSATKKENNSVGDAVALLIIIVVAGGVGYGIYRAKKSTSK